MRLSENLHAEDLRDLVKKVFEIDSFKSKIGEDEDVCVLSFSVDDKEAAEDLENFIEMGYSFVLDSDVTPGETDEGTFRVYVEIERNRNFTHSHKDVVNWDKFNNWQNTPERDSIGDGATSS